MWSDGYKNIINIDFSEPIIQAMKQRTKSLVGLEWYVMDMKDLSFPSQSFDIVLDKGSLDAIWTDGSSVWQPSQAVLSDITITIDEIYRVLRDGGSFISISFGQPHFRKQYLERNGWKITVQPLEDTFYFLYIAHKQN
jgi:ubiquinone/menaquinone biosynthesis C-methylase UbiE